MRRSNWTPVVVPTDRNSSASGADNGRSRVEREWGNEQPAEIWRLTTAAQETQLRTDLAFSVCVALALALPAFLGIGVYVASFVLLRGI
ncbi:hypothetical protein [Bradyrhizobium sp.]|uniref:hypothetical protein n=1 Tax=Bradyrhizobium sp. TaxID=376 RepID=UPI003C7140C8